MPGPGFAGRRAPDRWRTPTPRHWPDRRQADGAPGGEIGRGRHQCGRQCHRDGRDEEDADARGGGHRNRGEELPPGSRRSLRRRETRPEWDRDRPPPAWLAEAACRRSGQCPSPRRGPGCRRAKGEREVHATMLVPLTVPDAGASLDGIPLYDPTTDRAFPFPEEDLLGGQDQEDSGRSGKHHRQEHTSPVVVRCLAEHDRHESATGRRHEQDCHSHRTASSPGRPVS